MKHNVWIKRLAAIMLFFTPLLYTSQTNEGYEFPKMFFVYFVGATVAFLLALKLIKEGEKPKLNLFVLFYLVSFLVSTIFSSHLYTSVWGYYTRFNDGLVSVLIYVGIFLALQGIKKENFEKLLLAPVFSMLPVSVFGIYQFFEFEAGTRIYSTLGQPNWLAAYLGLVLPINLYFIFFLKEKDPKVKWLLHVSFVLGFATLWFTYSLSGILGFGGALVLFGLLNKKRIVEQKVLALKISTALALIVLLWPGIYKQRVMDVFTDTNRIVQEQEVAEVSEPATEPAPKPPVVSNNNISDPGYIRLHTWKGTLNLVQSSPKVMLIGTGPETFPYEFQAHRPKELNLSSEWNFIINKPHNYYLELLAETGVFGLAAYLGLLYFAFKKGENLIKPSIVSFALTNVFGWPTVATSLLFWILIAKMNNTFDKP